MSITTHTKWKLVKKYLVVEPYLREGGSKNPRNRIEIKHVDGKDVSTLLALTMPCVACGTEIHPIRSRAGSGNAHSKTVGHGFYFAGTCPLSENIACSRGKKAKLEYEAIAAAMSQE